MPSPKPAVIIRREFEATPQVVTQQLRACIIGPAYQLVRFANAAEKLNGFIKEYNTLTTETFTGTTASANDSVAPKNLLSADENLVIPSTVSNSFIDSNSVKVFAEDALLTYADVVDTGDASKDFRPGNTTAPVVNSLVLASATWRGTNRLSTIPQDVEVGDTVQLYTASGSTSTLSHTTKVANFRAEEVPGSIGTPTLSLTASSTGALSASTLTIGGVTFSFNAAGAYTTDAHYAWDPRRFNGTTLAMVVTIMSVSAGAVLSLGGPEITVRVANRDGNLTFNSKILTDGTVTLTLPNGITLTALNDGVTPVTAGATGNISYTITHTPYTYNNNQTGSLRLTTSGTISSALTANAAYTITCTSGGSVRSSTGASFTVTDTQGVDQPGSFTINNLATGSDAEVAIGSYGLKLKFGVLAANNNAAGFAKGDRIVIPVTAASAGAVRTLIVAEPYIATNPIVRVRLSKRKTIEIPKYQFNGVTPNWTLNNPENPALTRLSVKKTVLVKDSSVNAGDTILNITAGKFYIEYRSVLNLPRAVGSVNTLSDITTQLGTIDADNPLAYAVYKAWSNANGATVHFIPTMSDTLNGDRGFADALELAKGNRNCYGLVPLSASSEVWNAFAAHVQDESAPEAGRYRILWIAPEVDSHYKVQDSPIGNPSAKLLGTSSVVSEANGEYLVTVSAGARFTENVRIGDWVRTNFDLDPTTGAETYAEYRVLNIVDNLTLVIGALQNPALTSDRLEIYRDLTSAEAAQIYVQIAGGFSSERIFAVVPNRGVSGLRVDGKPVRNWNVAAAFAGLRSGSRPHQPLSNVELKGFDGTNATVPAFNEADLDVLRDGGVWVVVNNDEGKIYAERQLSTSTLDNFRKEQSVTCNIDSISFSVGDGLKNIVGRVNITDANLSFVRASLDAILTSFKNATGSESIGAQLRDFTIDEISVPSTANDTVKAKVSVSVPLPMNIIDITIVI